MDSRWPSFGGSTRSAQPVRPLIDRNRDEEQRLVGFGAAYLRNLEADARQLRSAPPIAAAPVCGSVALPSGSSNLSVDNSFSREAVLDFITLLIVIKLFAPVTPRCDQIITVLPNTGTDL